MKARRTDTAIRLPWADRGSLSVEMALFAPVIVLLVMLGLLAHSVASAQIGLQTATHAAARAATVETTPQAATAAASATAEAMVPDSCTGLDLQAEVGDLTPGGTVTVTLTCTVSVDPFGSRTVTATASSPVDQWRSGGTS
ncbi:TadE/TadG family type IV pilus assembly protein [Glycomyces tenuis]|uniref:TadE/TadG family type IV pilus assembly protein n=1 Tax=Glycomyces tenuis TaxID=58116 RepID=UPI00040042BD|nr:TadE/TadG family type IV pilus assembly protein [Glycomyces tenuis]